MKTDKFNQILKQRRKSKKLTQGDVADFLRVTTSFYSALEMGKRPPSPAILNQLIGFFSLSNDDEKTLHDAAAESIAQIRIDSSNAKPNARSMALSLARRFDSLEDEQIKELQEILND